MVVRFVGAATGLPELERDGPQTIHECLVRTVTYFSYWLACPSGRRLQ